MFCAIFSTISYISGQVTRNALPPLRKPDQRSGMHKFQEDTQVQRQAKGFPKSQEIQDSLQTGRWRFPLLAASFGEVPFPATM